MTDLHARYAELIDDAQSTVFNSKNLVDPVEAPRRNFARAQFLFDSIVVASHPIDGGGEVPGTVFNFFAALADLMEKSFKSQLPLRGCIGLGSYLEDEARAIFLSEVFPTIVGAERCQEWSGCLVMPDAATASLRELEGPNEDAWQNAGARADRLLVRYDVPFKERPAEPGWCLNWVDFMADEDLASGMSFLVGPKHENTSRFADHVRSLPGTKALLPDVFLPATHARLQVARGGLRIKFCDPTGRGFDPPHGAQMRLQFGQIVPASEGPDVGTNTTRDEDGGQP